MTDKLTCGRLSTCELCSRCLLAEIEDGAHKLLRAATSCACLELARARRRHLKPARPQRCQSLARAACSALGWLLNWTKVPHALSGHPICWSRSNGRSLAGGVLAVSKAMYTAVRVRSAALCLQLKSTHEF